MAIKAFPTSYIRTKFQGVFEEDWTSHARDFIAVSEDYELQGTEMEYFLRYTLKRDARQLYNMLIEQNKPWNDILKSFNGRYASDEKEDEISSRLAHLSIDDCRKGSEGDEHVA